MSTPSGSEPLTGRAPSRLRTVIELGVSLVVLVVLFRTFLAGGYMIETGSMAPCLLGYHRRAVCPSCGYSFAVEGNRGALRAGCSNCGFSSIPLESLPRNDGDHLLVEREGFALRPPRRWEVVVFRNPTRPTQAYVKRMIALPGETVEIVEGDIFVDGRIQTKPHATQRGMRIPVYDYDFRPDDDDPDWQPRWLIAVPDGGWTAEGGAFRHAPPSRGAVSGDGAGPLAWIEYRHWIRGGGKHRTTVAVSHWPSAIPLPERGMGQLTYDPVLGRLSCRGALSREQRDALLPPIGDAEFRAAIDQLYESSHDAPITDAYGYNSGSGGGGDEPVRDLMLEMRLAAPGNEGEFAIELSDGTETLQCLLDLTRQRAQLIDTRTGKAVRSGPLPGVGPSAALVEMSLMDQQALVAVDGKPIFEPWSYPAAVERGPVPVRPVRFGARGGHFEVSALKLFRDVHYTAPEGMGHREGPRRLGPDEYFVLGDNSPVSRDSRMWPDGTLLGGDLFVGKPLVVHLPSRRARFRIGSWQTEIRIPEPSRIRYIR